MKTKVTLSPQDISDAIAQWLVAKGFHPVGPVRIFTTRPSMLSFECAIKRAEVEVGPFDPSAKESS